MSNKVGKINAYVIDGTRRDGKPYTAIQFGVETEQGEYLSQLCFPTPLELQLVIDAIEKGEKD